MRPCHALARPLPLPSSRACGASLAAVLAVACGDDVGSTDATTDASATATTTSSTAASTTSSATSSTTSAASESDSGTGTTTTGETTTPGTTTTDGSSGSTDPGSASETAGTDTGVACEPGATESCYSGPEETLDVGVCVAGTRTCNDEGTGFGPCEGEVTPTAEQCGTADDENCLGDAPECGAALWKARFGGIASDEGGDLALDPAGGIVLTGVFDASSSINFGGDTLNNKGSFDGLLASFDGDGGHRWSRAFGSPVSDFTRSVAVDTAGAVIVTGDTLGVVDFGGGVLTSSGDQDVVVAKFDDAGNHLWSAIYKGPKAQLGLHCAVTSDDAVLLGGILQGSLDLGGGDLVSAGGNDIYLSKRDPDGKHLWSRRFGDAEVDFLSELLVSPGDAITLAGYFDGTLDLGGGALVAAGGHDVFVATLDPDGGHLWSKRFGDASDQRVEAAATAADGRVLVGGSFTGSLDFGGDVLTSDGAIDAFIAVLDGDGGHLWSRRLHGPNNDRVTTIAVDVDGNTLVGGIFAGSIDVGGAVLTHDGLYGSFLAKYDPAGALLFSTSYASDATNWLTNIAADSLGDAFLLGHFKDSIVIDGDTLVSAGYDDIFLAKIAP